MSRETSKTNAVRGERFKSEYLTGRVIDIGCGPDPIIAHAEPFDIEHGDAQDIALLRPQGAYDTVCSSHCLEHMRDVPRALAQWWSLVRAGGCLIVVVPDEDLYEQGAWPSLFNGDHKATFRFKKKTTWSPASYDLEELVSHLDGAEIVSYERHDENYDHDLRKSHIGALGRILFKMSIRPKRWLNRTGLGDGLLARMISRFFRLMGAPVDQTSGAALAQIQIIVRKSASRSSSQPT